MPKHPSNLSKITLNSPLDELTEKKAGWFGHIEHNPYVHPKYEWGLIVYWEHCRDLFQDAPKISLLKKGMWFCHGVRKNSGENVCHFIDKIENHLGLKVKTEFQKTQNPTIIWCQPSEFWINDFVRKSFFSLALRSGMRYRESKDNFIQVMCEKYKISRETKPAIRRFLDGYTFYPYDNPKYNTMGWHFLFSDMDDEKVKSFLVKGKKDD